MAQGNLTGVAPVGVNASLYSLARLCHRPSGTFQDGIEPRKRLPAGLRHALAGLNLHCSSRSKALIVGARVPRNRWKTSLQLISLTSSDTATGGDPADLGTLMRRICGMAMPTQA